MSNAAVDTRKFYSDVYVAEKHSYAPGQNTERPTAQLELIKRYLATYCPQADGCVVEVGCGVGHLHACHPNWRGFEFSDTAVAAARKNYGKNLNVAEGDATALPLADASVDFLFSFATLEHVPQVEKALAEVERVLKKGGVAVLSPAWNCRPWTVKKLEQRPYGELSLSEKIGKFLIPLRNNLGFRMLCSIPARLKRELALLRGKPLPLDYRKLHPDFSLWERYPHISDDDAFVSMDAHAALAYFASRGWTCPSHPGAARRFACRGEEIVVVKPR